jgi:hypothetical protein
VAAVLERSIGLPLGRSELFGAVGGGIKVDDPAGDLAVAAALASAATGQAPPEAAAFVGEIALTGQVRPAPAMEQRVAARPRCGLLDPVRASRQVSRGFGWSPWVIWWKPSLGPSHLRERPHIVKRRRSFGPSKAPNQPSDLQV